MQHALLFTNLVLREHEGQFKCELTGFPFPEVANRHGQRRLLIAPFASVASLTFRDGCAAQRGIVPPWKRTELFDKLPGTSGHLMKQAPKCEWMVCTCTETGNPGNIVNVPHKPHVPVRWVRTRRVCA